MDEDLDVVERVRAGEIQAYAVLVRKYQGRVRGYCLGVLGNAADADDAAQEVFIKAYRGLAGFGGRSSFSTWLYRITVNHCRDLLRSPARGRSESLEALREEEGEAFEARLAVRPEGQPSEQEQKVREALAYLPEDYKAVLMLREAQGLSYQEVAESLGCSLDAVKARLRRARAALEERFREGEKHGSRVV